MIFTDYETYCELNIKDVGTHRYAVDSEPMLLSFKVDGRRADIWDITDGGPMPAELEDAVYATDSDGFAVHRFCAYNAAFERLHYAKIGVATDVDDWEDAAVLALTCGLPGKLEKVSIALGWGDTEKKMGDRLINLFCTPAPKNHKVRRYTKEHKPEEWEQFKRYCINDAELCYRIWHTLPRTTYDRERNNWLVDQRLNDRGFPVDTRYARAAIHELSLALAEANAELAALTGGAVTAATQVDKLHAWLHSQLGYSLLSMDKASVLNALRNPKIQGAARRALEIRQEASLTSGSKFARTLRVQHEGRVRGGLRFYGAGRTGRESGQLVQSQNMMRPGMKTTELHVARKSVTNGTVRALYPSPLNTISSTVRTVIAAPKGKKLIVSDLSNIEGRMLAFNAGEEWKLQAFRDYDNDVGPDLYRLSYSRSFEIALELIDDDMRQVGKVQELACGYQGAIAAFHSMGEIYDVYLPDDDASKAVGYWRATNPAIVAYWYDLQRAALQAMQNPNQVVRVGGPSGAAFRLIKWGQYKWLLVKLQSGRTLFYFEPEVRPGSYGPQVTFMGTFLGGGWGRLTTYGGKWAENITQANARDVLMPGIERATNAGYHVVMHSHDELVAETPDSDEFTVDGLSEYLIQKEPWYEGLPLSAKGYEDYIYRKD